MPRSDLYSRVTGKWAQIKGFVLSDGTSAMAVVPVDGETGEAIEQADISKFQQQIKDYGDPAIVTLVTPGTPVQFTATSTPCLGVMVTAGESNTGSVSIGKSGSATVGTPVGSRKGIIPILNPGASVKIPITNMNLLYLDGITAGNIVSVIPYNGGS